MAEGIMFHYRQADTPLHRTDSRVKLLSLLVLSISIVLLPPKAVFVFSLYALVLALISGLPVVSYLREGKVFLILGLMLFAGRWMSSSLPDALYITGRFFTVVLFGLLLMDSTSVEESAAALYWGVSYISKKRAGILSAQLMLTLAAVPMIFDSVTEIREARQARGDVPRRHPLRFLITFSLQVLDVLLEKADEMSLALESRSFTGTMHPDIPSMHARDYGSLACTAGILIIAAVVGQ